MLGLQGNRVCGDHPLAATTALIQPCGVLSITNSGETCFFVPATVCYLAVLIEETVRHCCDGDFASSIASRRPWFWHSLCRKTGPPDSLPKSQPRMVATPPNIARDCEVGHKGSDPNKRRIM